MSYHDIALDFYRTGGDHSVRGTPSVVKIRPEYRVGRWAEMQRDWAARSEARDAANVQRVAAMREEEKRVRREMAEKATRSLVDLHVDRIKAIRKEGR